MNEVKVEVWSWQAEQEMKSREKGEEGRVWLNAWSELGNEMRGEDEWRSRVMAGSLPSNLINMLLGVALCSLSFHTLTALRKNAHEIRRERSVCQS